MGNGKPGQRSLIRTAVDPTHLVVLFDNGGHWSLGEAGKLSCPDDVVEVERVDRLQHPNFVEATIEIDAANVEPAGQRAEQLDDRLADVGVRAERHDGHGGSALAGDHTGC